MKMCWGLRRSMSINLVVSPSTSCTHPSLVRWTRSVVVVVVVLVLVLVVVVVVVVVVVSVVVMVVLVVVVVVVVVVALINSITFVNLSVALIFLPID